MLRHGQADLGAGLRRKEQRKMGTATVDPWSSPLAVPLQKVGAKMLNGSTAAIGGPFYVGNISIGQPPQNLRVVFDTSSGHVLLSHRSCQSLACREHQQYSPWASHTSQDVNIDGSNVTNGATVRDGINITFTQADLGSGSIKGVFVRDQACLGQPNERQVCANLPILTATAMDDTPFRAMPYDGIVGLSLPGLAATPAMSFFKNLAENSVGLPQQFGLYFGATKGEIFFGGYNHEYLAAPLQWFPVLDPDMGYWQVSIRSVRVGNTTIDACLDGCRAIVDTSVARVGVQSTRLDKLRRALTATDASGTCWGPDLEFDLGGFAVKLRAEDYTDSHCTPELGPLEIKESDLHGVYAFGEAVLHEYYAVFDWEKHRMGFAPATERYLRHGRDIQIQDVEKTHTDIEAMLI